MPSLDVVLAVEDRGRALDRPPILFGFPLGPGARRQIGDGAVRELLAGSQAELAAMRRVGQPVAAGGVLHEDAVGQVVDERPQQVALRRQGPRPLVDEPLELGAQLLEAEHRLQPDDVHEQRHHRGRRPARTGTGPTARTAGARSPPETSRPTVMARQASSHACRQQQESGADHEQQEVRGVARIADQVQVRQAVESGRRRRPSPRRWPGAPPAPGRPGAARTAPGRSPTTTRPGPSSASPHPAGRTSG